MRRLFASVLLAGCLVAGCGWGRAQQASVSSAAAAPSHDETWWKHAVIYEIYPRSFQDSNGDGIGDLNGIRERLGYLQALGVDAIWIAPMYPSPQVDFGYDISNYEAVDPQYGTLKDFDALVAAGKQHNIRIILDMVLNHTSDKHRWFVESASSRTNAKADWYVWNDGVKADAPGVTAYQKRFEHDGMVPPNNWESTVWRVGVGVGAGEKAVLLPPLLQATTGSELEQPGGGEGDVRHDAVLAGPRCGGVPAGCDSGAV